MSEFPSTPLRLNDLLTDSQDFRKPMVLLIATVYDSNRIQIIINKEKKKEIGQSPGETRHKLPDVFSSAFTWWFAKVSQQ